MRICKEIEIDVSLGDFDSCDLLKELKNRGQQGNLDLDVILDYLRVISCPESIIKALQDWDKQPIMGRMDLEAWKALSRKEKIV